MRNAGLRTTSNSPLHTFELTALTFDEVLMDRREFVAATAAAAVAPLPALERHAQSVTRQYIELRRYHLLPGAKQSAFIAFFGDVAIPAMNRAGIGKVG